MSDNMATLQRQTVERLVTMIEHGVGEWSKPWTSVIGCHHNPITGNRYTGINQLLLSIVAMDNDYDGGEWSTYKGWQSVGAQVIKGSTGARIVKLGKFVPKADKERYGDEAKSRTYWRDYAVFHSSQVEGYESTDNGTVPTNERLEVAERWLAAIPADIRYGGDRAYYRPVLDTVHVPSFDAFKSSEHAYGTLAHELAHWTGHESRLNRNLKGRFGDDAYAGEELIAELSAAMSCAMLGIDTVERTDHAQYLAAWCRTLKADPSRLWTAASQASKASDYLASFASSSMTELVA